MLTINGSRTQDGFAATKAIAALMRTDAPKAGTSYNSVLTAVTMAAVKDESATYTEQHVVAVYLDLLATARTRADEARTAAEWCNARIDRRLAAELERLANQQPTTLAQLQALDTVVITRGTGPVQSRRIVENGTMGGATVDPGITTPPASLDADAQTGFGNKNATGGRIEEWSLGTQFGFASDGFMLIAEVSRSLVTLPKSDFASVAGEAGVCGYAGLRLHRVAIAGPGRTLSDDPVGSQMSGLYKEIGQNRLDVTPLLRQTAGLI